MWPSNERWSLPSTVTLAYATVSMRRSCDTYGLHYPARRHSWTIRHNSAMVPALQNHSDIHNSTSHRNAAKPQTCPRRPAWRRWALPISSARHPAGHRGLTIRQAWSAPSRFTLAFSTVPPPLAISSLLSGRCPPQRGGNSHEVTVPPLGAMSNGYWTRIHPLGGGGGDCTTKLYHSFTV